MSKVRVCDICGTPESMSNPVRRSAAKRKFFDGGRYKWRRSDICRECVLKIKLYIINERWRDKVGIETERIKEKEN